MPRQSGNFIWYELITDDIEAAATFYGAVTGWTAQDSQIPGQDYWMFGLDGTFVGGLLKIGPQAAAGGMRPAWLGYVGVPDVEATVASFTAAGGSVKMPVDTIPGVGRIALLADPQGALIYAMTPEAAGASTVFAPGKPGHGGWHELHTTDWKAALDFYGREFGWGESSQFDMAPMGTYLLFHAGADAIGGMFDSRSVPHPAWLFYFNTEDIDAGKARIEAAGGRVLNGPHQVPGGTWIVQAQDPQGAMFALTGPRNA